MSGPAEQTPLSYIVPPGEAQQIFSPGALAWKIENFVLHPDGYLASIRGPCPYEVSRDGGSTYPTINGRPFGLIHAGLLGGIGDTLLLRSGLRLYRHRGWTRNYETLTLPDSVTNLNSELRVRYPDQWIVIGDKVIWANGIDEPLVITADSMVTPLGYDEVPGPPEVASPTPSDLSSRISFYPNALGYSWPGRIGTPGDVLSDSRGSLLAGEWFYKYRWEDIHGNLSAWSPRSRAAQIAIAHTSAYNVNEDSQVEDLTRQFLLSWYGSSPEHTVAVHIARTADTRRAGPEFQFLARLPGSGSGVFPDSHSDAELGEYVTDYVQMPIFRVMCAHQGALVIGNFLSSGGMVRKSERGFPGSLPKENWVFPDAGGAEITGLASHAGRLLAFTERSVYDLTDFGNPISLAKGIGCAAPRSIQSMPDGNLVWLSRDGFYTMTPSGQISLVSTPIQRTIREETNQSRYRAAVSAYDPNTGEYVCAVCPAGSSDQTMLMRFNGVTWRRMDMGITVDDICVTDDYRQLLLFCGRDITGTINGIWVMDREIDDYTPPTRTYTYQSAWMRADETGLNPVNVRTLYVGQVDGSNNNATVVFYRNGSLAPLNSQTDLRTVGPDDGSGVIDDIANVAAIGTSQFHERRLFWRQVPAGPLENCTTWAFKITSTTPINIASFAFDISYASKGSPRGRVPQAGDL